MPKLSKVQKEILVTVYEKEAELAMTPSNSGKASILWGTPGTSSFGGKNINWLSLYALLDNGFIEQENSRRSMTNYYHLTEKGKELAKELVTMKAAK